MLQKGRWACLMRFSRKQLTEIIQPHVLRTVVRLHSRYGGQVTEEELAQTKLTEDERRALIQTKRLIEESPGRYKVNLEV